MKRKGLEIIASNWVWIILAVMIVAAMLYIAITYAQSEGMNIEFPQLG